MRIVVDLDVCEANAVCMELAPHVFQLSDDEYLSVLVDEPPEDQRPLMEQAVRGCPKNAISIAD